MLHRKLFSRWLVLILVFVLGIQSAAGQESAQPESFDPQALAARYLGYSGETQIPPLTPVYRVGDQAQFWVGKTSSGAPTRVNATLIGANGGVYLWMEDGLVKPTTASLEQTAGQFAALLTAFRRTDNYREQSVTTNLQTVTEADLLPIPDVDNDPHLYVLYTTGLSEDREAVFNPIDSLPTAVAPFSNQHEMLYVNTTTFGNLPLTDPVFNALVSRAMYRWVTTYNAPKQAEWLRNTLDWVVQYSLQQAQLTNDTLTAYLQAPDTPMTQLPTLSTQDQARGGQQLFVGYLVQRYGSGIFNDLFLLPGAGLSAVDTMLANHGITDPVTGAPVTARDAFADFVVTNGLNLPFGDGRYVQTVVPLPQNTVTAGTPLNSNAPMENLSVSQFGAQYYRYTASTAGTVSVRFTGSPTTARLPMTTDRDPADTFYWSGSATDTNATLTRPVDLTGVSSATLTFDAWYDLAAGWNYGYVSVSSDDGATWKALPATTSSLDNRYGVAVGVGYTGVSNPEKPRPFPTIGILIAGDNVTVSDLVAGGGAQKAGVLKGDVIIGHDHTEWTTTPNVFDLLMDYSPGDTLNLYVQRGTQKLDIPVLLGAHPTRILQPPPLWQQQSVDLSAYAGQNILLRFESVTLPGHESQGFAVDNLAISEIGWTDDNTLDGWTADGWSAVDNQVSQQWIVQAATSGTQTAFPRVQQWIAPGSSASEGAWSMALDTGETLTLVVSGANEDTLQRASFNLEFNASGTAGQ